MKVREILRPKEVEIKIFEEAHVLRRLSMGDIFDLVSDIDFKKIDRRDPVSLLSGCHSATDKVLRASFPSFNEWDVFPPSEIPYLIELIVESNDIKGLLENFMELVGKTKKALPENVMKSLG